MLALLDLLAQDAAPADGRSIPFWANPIVLIIPFLIIVYLIMVRPQRQEQRRREEMLRSIRKNDRVMTIGGIIGTVVSVKDDEIVLKVDEANNTKLTFARSAIRQVLREPANEEAGAGKR